MAVAVSSSPASLPRRTGTILARRPAQIPEVIQSAVPTAPLSRLDSEHGNRKGSLEETIMLETARSNSQGNKILAIEDDPDVLALYKTYLQKKGYQVLSAAGAVEGMNLLQTHPDTRLILLDLNLPGMSGEEWITWYLAQGRHTPVVVASGKGDILTITKGNNMTAALTKPFHMEELQELIEVLLADDWHEQVSVDKRLH
jgi:CheY-like chemotaxis protein